jgi:hypothetical protein
MRLRIPFVVLAVLAVTAPLALADELTLKLSSREKQTVRGLKVELTCVGDPCEVEIGGKARAAGRKFALKPKTRSLTAREPEVVGLRIKRARELRELLDEAEGTATVNVRAANVDGAVAKLKARIDLTG